MSRAPPLRYSRSTSHLPSRLATDSITQSDPDLRIVSGPEPSARFDMNVEVRVPSNRVKRIALPSAVHVGEEFWCFPNVSGDGGPPPIDLIQICSAPSAKSVAAMRFPSGARATVAKLPRQVESIDSTTRPSRAVRTSSDVALGSPS